MESNGLPDTIAGYVDAVRNGRISVPDAIDVFLDRIRRSDNKIHAFLHVMVEAARKRARAIQEQIDGGHWPGPLAGVPIAVKDNILVKGHPATAGSRILAGYRAVYDATAVSNLLRAGAVIVGKANLDEFGMGSSNEFSAYGPTLNPYDTERVPGGSSGGSAAALAAGFCLGALGTDTGGSVRQPGAFCGLVGLKPQYGAVSRYGLIAFGSSLEQIGPMARTARDCALLYDAIRGHDPRDSTSLRERADVDLQNLGESLPRVRLGVPGRWLEREGVSADVREVFWQACRRFENLGFSCKTIELPDPDWGVAAYYILASAEASSNLARYDGVRYGFRSREADDLISLYFRTRGEGFGPEVKRRIMMGTYALSAGYYDAYYVKAMKVRSRIRAAYDEVFGEVDAVLLPTTPTPPFRIGEKIHDPLAMYLFDLFTLPANLTGFPAVTFPIGSTNSGLPIGAQLMGPALSEGLLLGLVRRFDEDRPHPLAPLAD